MSSDIIDNKKKNNDNSIISKIKINEENKEYKFRIINSFEEFKKNYSYIKLDDMWKYENEKEIKDSLENKNKW